MPTFIGPIQKNMGAQSVQRKTNKFVQFLTALVAS